MYLRKETKERTFVVLLLLLLWGNSKTYETYQKRKLSYRERSNSIVDEFLIFPVQTLRQKAIAEKEKRNAKQQIWIRYGRCCSGNFREGSFLSSQTNIKRKDFLWREGHSLILLNSSHQDRVFCTRESGRKVDKRRREDFFEEKVHHMKQH